MGQGMERVFAADLSSYSGLRDFVMGEMGGFGLSTEKLERFDVALEEAVVNVFKHAYANRGGEITVRISRNAHGKVTVEIEDSGPPFNPLERPEPDISLGIDAREPGGLGIHLIRHMVDEVSYRRQGAKNILTLTSTVS